jgi:DNA-binding PadR family transcriptional regulator
MWRFIHPKRSFVSTAALTPFSYVILVLVGEGGAGPHDLVRMMRQGAWAYWTSSQSQYYAEPKRLERLGLLSAARAPGRTHDRTVYRLTDDGRRALARWLGTPAGFPRIQNEAAVRLLGAEFAEPATVLEGLRGLREQIAAGHEWLDRAEEREPGLPHRERVLAINRRLARRMLEAQEAWLDEVEQELQPRPPRP